VPERVRRLAAQLPAPLGLAVERSHQHYLGLRSRRQSHRAGEDGYTDERGVPVPPRRLIRLVSGSEAPEQWLRSGQADAAMIRDLLARHGFALEDMEAILDLGCGCGRVLRWWSALRGPRVCGCDYDGRLTGWCQRHLRALDVKTNGSRPPLPYGAGSFDLVYAISLFTHLTETAQDEWLEEIVRALKPGGLALVTMHGERFTGHLDDAQAALFGRGELVVLTPERSGMEGCAAFHPPAYVRDRLLPRHELELLDAVYEDRSAAPDDAKPTMALQDIYLVRKPGLAPAGAIRAGT
jgi:SAM-dependent methyltransferase